MTKRALTIMADGFEDIEAIAPIDILSRAGVEVTIAGLKPGNIKAAYGTTIVPQTTINGVSGLYDAVILPGGRRQCRSLGRTSASDRTDTESLSKWQNCGGDLRFAESCVGGRRRHFAWKTRHRRSGV